MLAQSITIFITGDTNFHLTDKGYQENIDRQKQQPLKMVGLQNSSKITEGNDLDLWVCIQTITPISRVALFSHHSRNEILKLRWRESTVSE